jgi:hypothetical protein
VKSSQAGNRGPCHVLTSVNLVRDYEARVTGGELGVVRGGGEYSEGGDL